VENLVCSELLPLTNCTSQLLLVLSLNNLFEILVDFELEVLLELVPVNEVAF
jgi:hypothetical protein